MKPTSGTFKVNGFEAEKSPEQIRKNIGVLFSGGASLYDRLTVKENLYFFAELNGIDKKLIDSRIEELDYIFNFSSYLNKIAYNLYNRDEAKNSNRPFYNT